MKAISLSRPWDRAILYHGKRVENRPRWAPYPGLIKTAERFIGQDIALHSSQTWEKDDAAYIEQVTGRRYTRQDVPGGFVTGVVRLDGVLRPGEGVPVGQEAWDYGSVRLVLGNVRKLARPVEVKGALGFFELSADVEAEILGQLRVSA